MRIGLIGAGGFAHHAILPGIAEAGGAEVVSVFDVRQDGARDTAAAFGIRDVAPSIAGLLATPDIDLVWIAAPAEAHAELLSAVIQAGRDFICEKPVTLGSLDAHRLKAAADKAGVLAIVDHEYRYSAAFSQIRRLLSEGFIGEVRQVSLEITNGYSLTPDFPVTYYWTFGSLLAKGGGILPQLLSHFIDLFAYIFGGITPAGGHCAVSIKEKPTMLRHQGIFETFSDNDGPLRPVDAEDTVALAGRLPNGAPVSIAASWAVPLGEGIRWTMHGSEGMLIYESAGRMSDGQLRGGNRSIPMGLIAPDSRSMFDVPSGNYPSFEAKLIASQLRDIIASKGISGERRFATLSDEVAMWRVIEGWRGTLIDA